MRAKIRRVARWLRHTRRSCGPPTMGVFRRSLDSFELMLLSQLRRGQLHYAGITSLNLAQLLVWLDQGELAIRRAGDAEQYLQRSSRGYELVSVRLVQAQAQAQLGRWADCASGRSGSCARQPTSGGRGQRLPWKRRQSSQPGTDPRGLGAARSCAKVDRGHGCRELLGLDTGVSSISWLVSKHRVSRPSSLTCRPSLPQSVRSRRRVPVARVRSTRPTRRSGTSLRVRTRASRMSMRSSAAQRSPIRAATQPKLLHALR